MHEYFNEYAKVILKRCININSNKKLFISAPIESYEFIRILSNNAYSLGAKEVVFDFYDDYLKYDLLKHAEEKNIKKSLLINKSNFNKYAKEGYSFILLVSLTPEIMDDVNEDLLMKTIKYTQNTEKESINKRINDEIPWVIAAVATSSWAEKIFNKDKNSLEKLWKVIFKTCGIEKKDSIKNVNKKINYLNSVADKLTNMKLKKLVYKNKLGTNLTIGLPDNHIWLTAESTLPNKEKYFSNIPSEEVYTAPHKDKIDGIVYASKPLIYNGKEISNFYIEFKNGKIINFDAKKGRKALEEIINTDSGSKRLGEVALVNYDSPISKTGLIFYETLFDENASCHLAIGASYPASIKDGNKLTKRQLEKIGLNYSNTHIDFMIGTKDLEIIGYLQNGEVTEIFKNGNFVL